MQERKKELKKKQTEDHALLKKTGLNIDIVNEHEDDIKLAKLLTHKRGMLYLTFKWTQNVYIIYYYIYKSYILLHL